MRAWGIAFAIGAACGSGQHGGAPDANVDSYLDMPMRDQIAAIQRGEITGAQLEAGYRARIAERDPNIHAVLLVDPNADAKAADLDANKDAGAKLQGAVILLKDNIDTQGLATTGGSLALANNLPATDAFAAARLHAAHAMILGKTNLSEWANFRSTQSASGWSSAGGQTYNAHKAGYSPCGSSSGSAAAVAAGLASAAIGSETDGSIVCPASMNGVVGFKPTVGMISRTGVIPISSTQDTLGPITKTVGDAALIMEAIVGADPDDPATAPPAGVDVDFEGALATTTLSGKRFGVLARPFPAAIQTLFDQEKARMQAAGAVFVDVTLDNTWGNDEFTVLLTEFKVGIDAYLSSHVVAGQPKSLDELIAYDNANAARVMPYFGQEIFTAAAQTTGLGDPAYVAAKQRAHDAAATNGIAKLLADNNLDAIIVPTAEPAFAIDYTQGDASIVVVSGPAAVAGYPHLTMPMGTVNDLPVGISFIGGAWQDAKLLGLGAAYEKLPR
ncbi:MAG TPA: amidase [Kofleriaceae bacterium]|nr:amidase [Kofleriaceae bacterium]